MPENDENILNIGIVGGSDFACEVLEKTTQDYPLDQVNSRFVAIADRDLLLGRPPPDPRPPPLPGAASGGSTKDQTLTTTGT